MHAEAQAKNAPGVLGFVTTLLVLGLSAVALAVGIARGDVAPRRLAPGAAAWLLLAWGAFAVGLAFTYGWLLPRSKGTVDVFVTRLHLRAPTWALGAAAVETAALFARIVSDALVDSRWEFVGRALDAYVVVHSADTFLAFSAVVWFVAAAALLARAWSRSPFTSPLAQLAALKLALALALSCLPWAYLAWHP